MNKSSKDLLNIQTSIDQEVKQINLTYFMEVRKRNPLLRIGVLQFDINGLVSYKSGDFVLYKPYTFEELEGTMSYDDIQKHLKLCTIEIPNDKFFTGESNVDTVKTIIGIPLSYIQKEIITT